MKNHGKDYIQITPSAKKINDLLSGEGEEVINDHIALRTFSDEKVNLDVFNHYFSQQGYEKKGDYLFPEKNLNACHLENRDDPSKPKIFISELDLEAFSKPFQEIAKILRNIPPKITFEDLYNSSLPWKMTFCLRIINDLEKSLSTHPGFWQWGLGLTISRSRSMLSKTDFHSKNECFSQGKWVF